MFTWKIPTTGERRVVPRPGVEIFSPTSIKIMFKLREYLRKRNMKLTIEMTARSILHRLQCDRLCQTWRTRTNRHGTGCPNLAEPIHPHRSIHPHATLWLKPTGIYRLEKISILIKKFVDLNHNQNCFYYLNPLETATNWCRESNPSWMTHSRSGVDSLQNQIKLKLINNKLRCKREISCNCRFINVG